MIVKRKPHKVTIDDQDFFIRSLTQREVNAIDAAEAPAKLSLILMSGVCDVQGNAIISNAEELEDVPYNVLLSLSDEISNVSNPLKKRD